MSASLDLVLHPVWAACVVVSRHDGIMQMALVTPERVRRPY